MLESRKEVLKETLVVLIGQAVCVALMFAVYALLGKFHTGVLLGGIVGALLAAANFFFMAVVATLAADKAQADDVKGGKSMIQTSYMLRLVVLFVILFACAKSGWFDLIALVLPLAFVRPILMVGEFFRKAGDKAK